MSAALAVQESASSSERSESAISLLSKNVRNFTEANARNRAEDFNVPHHGRSANADISFNVLGAESALLDLPMPIAAPRGVQSVVLAEWEGSVIEVREQDLLAHVFPIRGQMERAIAEIPLEEIAPGDKGLAMPGALFRLAIGYEEVGGTRSRFSRIVFRRLPAWTIAELDQARATAQQQFDAIPLE